MLNGSFEEQIQAVAYLQDNLARFMQEAGVDNVVIEAAAVGRRAAAYSGTQKRDEQWRQNTVPPPLVEAAVRLRIPMARPGGGTWTWARFTMTSADYQLNTDFDYDRMPDLDPPVGPEDCAEELKLFPRDPRAMPDWMAAQ